MRFAIDAEWRTNDPTHLVRGYRLDGEGFHTWTEDEIAIFEQRHASGAKARLAMSLMLYAGQRRSDVVLMAASTLRTMVGASGSSSKRPAPCSQYRCTLP
jgi:hypothetical protein